MKKWATTIQAIDPLSGDLFLWVGPTIEAPTYKLAKEKIQIEGLGYCKIEGELVAEIPCDENMNPQWNKGEYYDLQNMN